MELAERHPVPPARSGFQFYGSNVANSLRLVRRETMRSSTSVSHVDGSTPFSFIVWIRVAMIDQCCPPPSEPAHKAFLRPNAMGHTARSTTLVSSSERSFRTGLPQLENTCRVDRQARKHDWLTSFRVLRTLECQSRPIAFGS